MGGGPELPPSMPSRSTHASDESSSNDKTMNVFVTGFGPFPNGQGGQFEENASHLVTKLLPESITVRIPKVEVRATTAPVGVDAGDDEQVTDSDPGSISQGSHRVKVKILNPTAGNGMYLPTEYARIRTFIGDTYAMHAPNVAETRTKHDNKVDIFLHIGQAAGWHHVTIERRAYKQGMTSSWWNDFEETAGYYMKPDNAGQTVIDAGENVWDRMPMGLETAFDVDELVSAANRTLDGVAAQTAAREQRQGYGLESSRGERGGEPLLRVQPHHEAGSYCCGFTYYESLAQSYVRGIRRNVLFCHVPGETDEATLKAGRDAIVSVIEAAVIQLAAGAS